MRVPGALPAADRPALGALPAPVTGISARRQLLGAAVGVVGLAGVLVGLAARREDIVLSTPVLLTLAVVVAVAIVGGIRPALPTAVLGLLLLNVVFTQPYGTFEVQRFDQALALAVYLAVAVAVSAVVAVAARRHGQAVRATAEAAQLSALAGARSGDTEAPGEVLQRVRDAFGLSYAAVVQQGTGGGWHVVDASGRASDDAVHERVAVSPHRALEVAGRVLSPDDRRVLTAFARAAVATLDAQELHRGAREAQRLAGVDQLRTALLAGVGHDLRTPLAGIKAAVTSLRAEDVTWTPQERAELLRVVEASADRLDALVANLLATSRLEGGAVSVALTPVDVDEVVGRGVSGLGDAHRVLVDLPESLPLVRADLGLAERVVANLVDNALRHSGRGTNVLVTGAVSGRDVLLSVVDTGPGVPASRYEELFTPYQRLGDRSTGGLGLGLSVARGFTEAMGGTLTPSATEGGGLTMTIRLRQA